MTREEMSQVVDDFIDEFFCTGKYSHLDGEDGLRRRTDAEIRELAKRIEVFFSNNDVPEDIRNRFVMSGVGESIIMSKVKATAPRTARSRAERRESKLSLNPTV